VPHPFVVCLPAISRATSACRDGQRPDIRTLRTLSARANVPHGSDQSTQQLSPHRVDQTRLSLTIG
jgi:hypothetical protein